MPPRLNLASIRQTIFALHTSSTSTLQTCSAGGSTTSRRNIASVTSGINYLRINSSNVRTDSAALEQRRRNSSKPPPKDEIEDPTASPDAPLPHVSEEAAQLEKIMHKDGGSGDKAPAASPELEQGTPVSEILQRDKDAQKHMPKVMQNQMREPNGSRSFSTSSRRGQLEPLNANASDPSAALVANLIAQANGNAAVEFRSEEAETLGLKFPAPQMPLPTTENFRKRYDSTVEQFTKLMMRDGKLSVAQKNMSFILDHLRTAPPPQVNPKRRLLPGPPGPQLPLNPVLFLTLIVDSVAPLIKIRQQKGIAGGGASVQIPVPLAERQRRRTAIRWIIDASDKRRDSNFAQRVANELMAVAEGRSGVWEKREHVHKLGIAGRSNLGALSRRPR